MRDGTSLARNSSFLRLWAAQFSAMSVVYGLGLAGVAVIEGLTRSNVQVSLVIISSILPGFLTSLFAGAVVDRFGRVRVLAASLVARVLIALGFWAGTASGIPALQLATVYAVNVTGIAVTQCAAAAETSLLPDLVVSGRLMSANALFQFSLLAAEGLGLVVIAPLVIRLAGAPAMGALGAAMYLIALVLVASLRKSRGQAEAMAGNRPSLAVFFSELQAGWRAILRDRMLALAAIELTLASVLLLVLLSLVPGLVSEYLGLEVSDVPVVLLPAGASFGIGLYLVGHWERQLNRPLWIGGGLVALGAIMALLALVIHGGTAAGFWISLPLMFGLGLALAVVIVPARTELQLRPPAEARGRVIAAQLALGHVGSVLPLVLGGALADWLGIRPVIFLLGAVAAIAGILALRYIHGHGPEHGEEYKAPQQRPGLVEVKAEASDCPE